MRLIIFMIDLLLVMGSVSLLAYLWFIVGDTSKPSKGSKSFFLSGKDILFKVKKAKTTPFLYDGFDKSAFLKGAQNVFMMMVSQVQGKSTEVLNYVVFPLSLHQIPASAVKGLQLSSVTTVNQVKDGNVARIHVQFMFQVPPSGQKGEVWIFERPVTQEGNNWMVVGLTSLAGFPKVHPFI